MADPIPQSEIDKIKEAAGEQDAKVDNLIISGGHGITVSGTNQSWEIAFDDNVINGLFQPYTLTICVDGTPTEIQVLVPSGSFPS
jgi:hypothetical protein